MKRIPFFNYVAIQVKRPGKKEPIYNCQPVEHVGFICGACGKHPVQEPFRWRCRCGARVVGAVPKWYAEKMAEKMGNTSALGIP